MREEEEFSCAVDAVLGGGCREGGTGRVCYSWVKLCGY